METWEERREFFRVDGQVHLWYRKVSEEEKRHLFQRHRSRERSRRKPTPLEDGKDTSVEQYQPFENPELEQLRACLRRLEEKLDLFLEQVNANPSEDEDVNFEPCFVNISGSGMRLPTKERFEVGDCLEIRVILPIMPNQPIHLLGEVIHILDTPDSVRKIGKRYRFDTGVKFISLLEEDRERIVQYAFHQQARDIRETRSVEIPS